MNRALFVVLLGAFDITVMWALCFSITARLPVVSGLQFKLVEFITCYSNPAADEHPWGNVAFFPPFIHRKITHSFVNAHNAHFILLLTLFFYMFLSHICNKTMVACWYFYLLWIFFLSQTMEKNETFSCLFVCLFTHSICYHLILLFFLSLFCSLFALSSCPIFVVKKWYFLCKIRLKWLRINREWLAI